MRLNVYGVFDIASGTYVGPLAFNSDAEAQRWFSDLCVNEDNRFGKHPHDYTLMRIATFDDNTGEINGEVPSSIINGLQCVHRSREVDREQMEIFESSISNGGNGHATQE